MSDVLDWVDQYSEPLELGLGIAGGIAGGFAESERLEQAERATDLQLQQLQVKNELLSQQLALQERELDEKMALYWNKEKRSELYDERRAQYDSRLVGWWNQYYGL